MTKTNRNYGGGPRWILAMLLAASPSLPAIAAETPAGRDEADLTLTLDELRTFADVLNLVRVNYVDEIGESELLEAALRGLVARLDPNSAYLGPAEHRAQDDRSRGRFAGIGAEVDIDDGRLRIAAVLPDGPAAHAGLVAGELIVAIDGRSVRGGQLPDSLASLQGEAGSTVSLRIQDRDGGRRTVVLERAWVPLPSVRAELVDGAYAWFGLSRFHDRSAAEFERALRSLTEALEGEPPSGIIIDLRGNPGGVISAAVDIADGFLDDGLIVYTRGRSEGAGLEYRAEPGAWAPGVPVAVLQDGASASASEILAGALQENGRAIVVGETSFGKGTVQSVLPLRNGGALKLTTARYHTPGGRSIDERAIEPDIIVAGGSGARGAGAERVGQAVAEDPVLAAALEALRGQRRD